MSNWSTHPPKDDSVPALRVYRTPPHRPFRSFILSDDVLGAMLHYHNGRSTKCPGPNCPLCKAGMRPRWYGYFAIYNPKSAARALFEIPKGAYIAFDDYLTKYPTLRGTAFEAFRKPDRPNGQVVIHLDPPRPDAQVFPDQPDVFRTLCQMWGLNWRQESFARAQAAREQPTPDLQQNRQTINRIKLQTDTFEDTAKPNGRPPTSPKPAA